MSPSGTPRRASARRAPYKPPRARRELYTAIAVGVLIVVATATSIWFLRPNRESSSTPVTPEPAASTSPSAPTGSTTPADPTAATSPEDPAPDTTATETTAP
jgi:hypothetical protein